MITAQHHQRAEVGLEQHQPERHRGQAEDRGEAPGVELAAVLVAVAGQRHDDPELRQLRRLQREPARELEPRLVALDVRAERREHREQQRRRWRGRTNIAWSRSAGSRSSSTATMATTPSPSEQRLALHEVELVARDARAVVDQIITQPDDG